jgi:hypothetical protein
MEKVCIGIPTFGLQEPNWWQPLMIELANAYKFDIEIVNVINVASMMTDANRNHIVYDFQSTTAEWLWWVDADNVNPFGSLRRLLDHKKTMVGGLYYKRNIDKPFPIAYWRKEDGRYDTINNWRRGEVISVDAAGMNCLLTHRSVFEDITKHFVPLMRKSGGIITVPRDNIQGDIFDDAEDPSDEMIVDGVLHQRLYQPPDNPIFPYFALEFGRTEDMKFYEMAKRSGHNMWIDTSIECGHLHGIEIGGTNYRQMLKDMK